MLKKSGARAYGDSIGLVHSDNQCGSANSLARLSDVHCWLGCAEIVPVNFPYTREMRIFLKAGCLFRASNRIQISAPSWLCVYPIESPTPADIGMFAIPPNCVSLIPVITPNAIRPNGGISGRNIKKKGPNRNVIHWARNVDMVTVITTSYHTISSTRPILRNASHYDSAHTFLADECKIHILNFSIKRYECDIPVTAISVSSRTGNLHACYNMAWRPSYSNVMR